MALTGEKFMGEAQFEPVDGLNSPHHSGDFVISGERFLERTLQDGFAIADVESLELDRVHRFTDRLVDWTASAYDNGLINEGYMVFPYQAIGADGFMSDGEFRKIEQEVRSTTGIDSNWGPVREDGHNLVVYLPGVAGPLHTDQPGANDHGEAFITVSVNLRGSADLFVWDSSREYESRDEVAASPSLAIPMVPGRIASMRCSVHGPDKQTVWHHAGAPQGEEPRVILNLMYKTGNPQLVEDLILAPSSN